MKQRLLRRLDISRSINPALIASEIDAHLVVIHGGIRLSLVRAGNCAGEVIPLRGADVEEGRGCI